MMTPSLMRSIAACLGFALLIQNRSLIAHLWSYSRALPGAERVAFDDTIRKDVAGLWLRNRWGVLLACVLAGLALIIGDGPTRQDRRLTTFTYLYSFGDTAGPRMWNLDDVGRWHEHGPSARERLFDIVKRAVVNGCAGSTVSETKGPQFVFFIPDQGCEPMSLLMSRDRSAWIPLGPITTATAELHSGR